jgi:hypothetical protein
MENTVRKKGEWEKRGGEGGESAKGKYNGRKEREEEENKFRGSATVP